MPKLPTVKPRVVIRFLEQSGFVLDHVSGSHFIFYNAVSRRSAPSCHATIETCQKEPLSHCCEKQGLPETN
jgi:predicted RNA binding protein YcfA (HicA-like mRNA interferase family)